MLAVIRARFPTTPDTAQWSDAAMRTWLDPYLPFSLAHFMTRTSFSQLDMRYTLFTPIVVADKRADASLGESVRERLVRGVLNEVTRMFDPDWDLLDQYLICFAGVVDMFGGGEFALPRRPGSDRAVIGGAVIDSASPFDAICQEVGHSFGLSHELSASGTEYGCPYSPMSAMGQGSSFVRANIPNLPVGLRPAADDPFNGLTNDVQRIIGPYIPAVHFYVRDPQFAHPGTVYEVPPSYERSPHSFRLDALDRGVSSWPQRRRVLAVLPSVNNGDKFFLELRRPVDYDAGLVRETTDGQGVPAAIVVYSYNAIAKRVTYVDNIPLAEAAGDRDFHSYRGHFAVRLNSFDDDLGSAHITVGGGNFWRHFGVSFDIHEKKDTVSITDWATANVAPCFLYEAKDHQYRYHFQRTRSVVQAISYGFEKPNYRWFLADQLLDPAGSTIAVTLVARKAKAGKLEEPASETVQFEYKIVRGRLLLSTSSPLAGVAVLVKVIVNESARGVLLNAYPDQSSWTNVAFDNVSIEWDAGYVADMTKCWKKFTGTRFVQQTQRPFGRPDPGPRFDNVSINVLIEQLSNTNPVVANAVINEVSRIAGISRLDVLRRIPG